MPFQTSILNILSIHHLGCKYGGKDDHKSIKTFQLSDNKNPQNDFVLFQPYMYIEKLSNHLNSIHKIKPLFLGAHMNWKRVAFELQIKRSLNYKTKQCLTRYCFPTRITCYYCIHTNKKSVCDRYIFRVLFKCKLIVGFKLWIWSIFVIVLFIGFYQCMMKKY